MSEGMIKVPPKGGFSFDLCRRNDVLAQKGAKAPSYWTTGTTIVGLIFQDGVVLGADIRAIKGPIVCDKNWEKIHYMAPNLYCCGARTAADMAALVLGGIDVTGPHLHTIYPHGSTDTLLFATMGSGSLAAISVFESKYREGLTVNRAITTAASSKERINLIVRFNSHGRKMKELSL